MIDFSSNKKWLTCTLRIVLIMQMMMQGAWGDESPFKVLGVIEDDRVKQMEDGWKICMPFEYGLSWAEIMHAYMNKYEEFYDFLQTFLTQTVCKKVDKVLSHFPKLSVKIFLVNLSNDEAIEICNESVDADKPITVEMNVQYCIRVEMTKNRSSTEAVCPRFMRSKEECWNVILGYGDRDKLISIKKVAPFKLKNNCKLDFEVPREKGKFYISFI